MPTTQPRPDALVELGRKKINKRIAEEREDVSAPGGIIGGTAAGDDPSQALATGADFESSIPDNTAPRVTQEQTETLKEEGPDNVTVTEESSQKAKQQKEAMERMELSKNAILGLAAAAAVWLFVR